MEAIENKLWLKMISDTMTNSMKNVTLHWKKFAIRAHTNDGILLISNVIDGNMKKITG